MTDPRIQRALVRLDRYSLRINTRDVSDEAAALIRKAAEPQDVDELGLEHSAGWCVICGGPTNHHRTDCALIAICEAIAGEEKL
jgi:hypothetical protein